MHASDKIPRFALGVLGSKNVERNVFVDGEKLVEKARQCAAKVSNAYKKRKGLKMIAEDLDKAVTRLVLDKGATRMSSTYTMLKSVLKNETVMKKWISDNPGGSADGMVELEATDWEALREIEALLQTMSEVTTITQYETAWTAAYRIPLYFSLKEKLGSDSVAVLMLDSQDGSRMHKPIMTAVAKEVQKRGLEEAERRIGTSLKEFTRQGNENVEKFEMAALLLDLRTKSDRRYSGEDNADYGERRGKIIAAFQEVVFEYELQVLRNTKYLNIEEAAEDDGYDSNYEADLMHFETNIFPSIPRTIEEKMRNEARAIATEAGKNWMKLKSDQPTFWLEHMPGVFDAAKHIYIDRRGEEKIDPVKMIDIDVLPLYLNLSEHAIYGVVARCAMSILGRNLSESFVERLFSAGKFVLNERSSNMDRELMEMRTLLRMNKNFIESAKEKFPDLLLKEVKLESDAGKKKQENMMKEDEDSKRKAT